MTNAELFEQTFGRYATEVWALPEDEFLEWLNADVHREAFDMAIKALEQQPCGDCISRAEAIRIASGYCAPQNIAKELRELPSVTPQPKTGRWLDKEVGLPILCQIKVMKVRILVFFLILEEKLSDFHD